MPTKNRLSVPCRPSSPFAVFVACICLMSFRPPKSMAMLLPVEHAIVEESRKGRWSTTGRVVKSVKWKNPPRNLSNRAVPSHISSCSCPSECRPPVVHPSTPKYGNSFLQRQFHSARKARLSKPLTPLLHDKPHRPPHSLTPKPIPRPRPRPRKKPRRRQHSHAHRLRS